MTAKSKKHARGSQVGAFGVGALATGALAYLAHKKQMQATEKQRNINNNRKAKVVQQQMQEALDLHAEAAKARNVNQNRRAKVMELQHAEQMRRVLALQEGALTKQRDEARRLQDMIQQEQDHMFKLTMKALRNKLQNKTAALENAHNKLEFLVTKYKELSDEYERTRSQRDMLLNAGKLLYKT